jgi:hypothetical protein
MAYRKMIAVCMTALTTSGCAAWNTLESQARADPRTVAAYPAHDVSRNVRQTTGSCAITRLRGDAYDVPINLDCFRFPEQRTPDNSRTNLRRAQRLAGKRRGTDLHRS